MTDLGAYLSDSERKRRRRRRRFMLIAGVLLFLCVLGFAAWAALFSPWFQIRSVIVEGATRIRPEEVIAFVQDLASRSPLAPLAGSRNILLWPASVSPDDLRRFPAVKTILIRKEYRARIVRASLEEREPFGIWCFDTAKQCFWFDREGVLFDPAPAAEGALIKTVKDSSQDAGTLGGRILPARFAQNAISVIETLTASGLAVREIRLRDLAAEELSVSPYAGPELYFSLRMPASGALPVLQSLMESASFGNLEYIDFRTENRVFYK